jgi:hypothetical protein
LSFVDIGLFVASAGGSAPASKAKTKAMEKATKTRLYKIVQDQTKK